MNESAADVSWFNSKPENTSNNNVQSKDVLDIAVSRSAQAPPPGAQYYDMSGDKYLIIFNHETYKSTRYFNYKKPNPRNGTHNDVRSLQTVFKKLDFKVTVHTNLDHDDIIKELSEVCNKDHGNTSCICVAILTHGSDGGEVYAADRPYQLNDVMSKFRNGHTSLVGKPKLFFIQACRGKEMDDGRTIQLDGNPMIKIPTYADFLVLYSSVDDHLSYRDCNGSWMIQALCGVIEEHYEDLDILHMITLVHQRVAYDRITYTPRDERMNNKKQMPETRFTLTKLFKF